MLSLNISYFLTNLLEGKILSADGETVAPRRSD